MKMELVSLNDIFYRALFVNFFLLDIVSSETVDPLKGKVYSENGQSVLVSSIIKTLSNVSKTACVLRCRRSKECAKAAMHQKDTEDVCLHLKNSTITDGEAVNALVLEEFENKAYRKFTYHQFSKLGV